MATNMTVIRMRMREYVAGGSAEAQPRKAHMTRSRKKLVPRHETESSGHARGALAYERGEGWHFK